MQQPRQGDLARRCAPTLRELSNRVGQHQVGIEVLALQAWIAVADVALRITFGALHRARQKAATQWAERHQADAELSQQWNDARLEIALPQRVFALQRRNRMHRVRAANRGLARLRQPEIANLASPDQRRHRADHVLDRNLAIDAMLVEQIDMRGLQTLERGLDDCANVLGTTVGTADLAILDLKSELGGDHDRVAATFQGPSEQLLILEGAIDLGGIVERGAELDRALNGRQRLGVVGCAIGMTHAHAAKPQRGDAETLAAQLACLHALFSMSSTRLPNGSVTNARWQPSNGGASTTSRPSCRLRSTMAGRPDTSKPGCALVAARNDGSTPR